jgi:ribulose-phosphate 3-epimerase
MANNFIIAPSLLSADFARLGEETDAILNAGADWIHFDVMDNHYVPNLSFGPLVCEALRRYGITVPIDVHLMVKPVDSLIPAFATAGATMITFHPEASDHVDRTIQLIKDQGCQVGVALNPASPLSLLDHIIDKLDMVLLMSVNPGFGGQKFIPSVLEKAQHVTSLIQSVNPAIRLEIDGGVTPDNCAKIAQAGVDTFVMGSALFHSDDYGQTIQKTRAQLATV